MARTEATSTENECRLGNQEEHMKDKEEPSSEKEYSAQLNGVAVVCGRKKTSIAKCHEKRLGMLS